MVMVTVEESHKGLFTQEMTNGRHTSNADVETTLGGLGDAPSPYDRLMSALGSCTAMTMKMYADVKKWPLEGVDISLTHHKEQNEAGKFIDVITREINIRGEFTDEQKMKLLEIANKCPIHRTLESHPEVTTTLTPKTAEDEAMSAEPPPKRPKPKFSFQSSIALRAVQTRSTGEGKFTQEVTAPGGHKYITDEPQEVGGLDKGPNPYEELLAALGSCTSMKVRREAEKLRIPLVHISVELSHDKVKENGKLVDKIDRQITLKGNLTEEQRQVLLDAANNCPILLTMEAGPKIETVLAKPSGPAAAKPSAPPPAIGM